MKEKTAHGGKRRKKMFFGNMERLEIAQDKETANKLLNENWLLLDIMGNGEKFFFVLGKANHSRVPTILGLREENPDAENESAACKEG